MKCTNKIEENNFSVDKIDKRVEAMENDVRRHETVCCELATKFDQQNEVLK